MSFGIRSVVRCFPMASDRVRIARTIYMDFKRIPLFPQNYQRRIDCNAREPGGEARSGLKGFYVKKRAYQGILQSIFSIFSISRNAIYDLERSLAYGLEELVEGCCVPALCRRHQLLLIVQPGNANRIRSDPGQSLRTND